MEEWELWWDDRAVASYVCVTLLLNFIFTVWVEPLEGMKIETQKGIMICISFSFSLNLFIDLAHRLAADRQAQGHGLPGEAVHSSVGAPMTLWAWLFSQMIKTRCPGFQTGFCHVNSMNFLTQELCYIGFRDLCPKPMVKVLSHDRTVIASFLGWNLEVSSFALYMRERVFLAGVCDLGLENNC